MLLIKNNFIIKYNMLNINELNNVRDKEIILKYKIYNNILLLIHKKIKYSSKRKLTNTLYIIPKFIVGLPTYDQIKCAEYCIKKLRKNGFLIVYTCPNMIYISWDHVPSELKKNT